ncbi:MAG: hypothetical protein HFG32_03545 [Eubacterium sp.]|nr:hypothetical protein [Eubacterium sp.]
MTACEPKGISSPVVWSWNVVPASSIRSAPNAEGCLGANVRGYAGEKRVSSNNIAHGSEWAGNCLTIVCTGWGKCVMCNSTGSPVLARITSGSILISFDSAFCTKASKPPWRSSSSCKTKKAVQGSCQP